MNRKRLLASAVLVGVFVFGAISGVAFSRWRTAVYLHRFLSRPTANPGFNLLILALDRAVTLSDAQEQQVWAIFEAQRPLAEQLTREMEPRIAVQRTQVERQISALLRPDQQQRYQELLRRNDARRMRAWQQSPQ